MDATSKTIELVIGHTDGKGVRHTHVSFGKRLRGRELFEMDADQQSEIPTQHKLMVLRGAITAFGTLPLPVPLSTLLKLDVIDIDDLMTGYNDFLAEGVEGRTAQFISESEVKLPVGYENNGIVYNRVQFGNRITGMELIAAEKEKLTGLKRECFLIGKQIKTLLSEDGKYSLDGTLELQVFEKLDGVDILDMRAASLIWRQSFRAGRSTVSEGNGESRAGTGP